jgi:multidrug efflux system membrane fusion protein
MVMFVVSACELNNPVTQTQEPTIHEVTVHSIKNIDFPRILWASGQVVAAHRLTVNSKVSGYIRSVLVDEGNGVTKGQLLVEIDSTEVNTGITKATADIKSAKASLEDAKSDVTRFRKLASTQALSEDQLRDAQVLVVTTVQALRSCVWKAVTTMNWKSSFLFLRLT